MPKQLNKTNIFFWKPTSIRLGSLVKGTALLLGTASRERDHKIFLPPLSSLCLSYLYRYGSPKPQSNFSWQSGWQRERQYHNRSWSHWEKTKKSWRMWFVNLKKRLPSRKPMSQSLHVESRAEQRQWSQRFESGSERRLIPSRQHTWQDSRKLTRLRRKQNYCSNKWPKRWVYTKSGRQKLKLTYHAKQENFQTQVTRTSWHWIAKTPRQLIHQIYRGFWCCGGLDWAISQLRRLMQDSALWKDWIKFSGWCSSRVNRELKHRRFWATDVNRKSRFLLFDAYFTLFIQKVKF